MCMWTEVPAADLLSAGRFDETPEVTVYREHGARNWMMSLTVSGTADYWTEGAVVTAVPGDLVLIAPGTLQHYRASTAAEPWGYWWAHFQPRRTWFDWLRLPEMAPGFSLTRFGDGDRLRRADAAFDRVHRNAMHSTMDAPQGRVPVRRSALRGAFATELALNAIEELVLMAVMEHEADGEPAPDPRVQQVLDIIAADPAAPLSVDALARAVSLSSSRLAHLFRSETGDSIGNVVQAMRLRKAAALLASTDRPVGRIAAEVGFASPYYFSRQFRARFGQPPTAYRAQARETTRSP